MPANVQCESVSRIWGTQLNCALTVRNNLFLWIIILHFDLLQLKWDKKQQRLVHIADIQWEGKVRGVFSNSAPYGKAQFLTVEQMVWGLKGRRFRATAAGAGDGGRIWIKLLIFLYLPSPLDEDLCPAVAWIEDRQRNGQPVRLHTHFQYHLVPIHTQSRWQNMQETLLFLGWSLHSCEAFFMFSCLSRDSVTGLFGFWSDWP